MFWGRVEQATDLDISGSDPIALQLELNPSERMGLKLPSYTQFKPNRGQSEFFFLLC